jgi:ABC-2 type transport system ATP-binding protein
MTYLRTTQLNKKFSSLTAVNNVDLHLENGKIYGLLGPNGSGKSTLMKMIAGLIHPTSGNIQLDNEPIGTASKASIAFMPTEAFLYTYMTVKLVGTFYHDFYADFDMTRYENLIDRMQLTMNLKVANLSTGMTSKLKVAATMARNAKIYMLDEPLNGIDLIAREEIVKAILESTTDESILLMSSHLVDELENIIDDVIFMKDGHVFLQGNAEMIRQERQLSIVDLYKEVYKNL